MGGSKSTTPSEESNKIKKWEMDNENDGAAWWWHRRLPSTIFPKRLRIHHLLPLPLTHDRIQSPFWTVIYSFHSFIIIIQFQITLFVWFRNSSFSSMTNFEFRLWLSITLFHRTNKEVKKFRISCSSSF